MEQPRLPASTKRRRAKPRYNLSLSANAPATEGESSPLLADISAHGCRVIGCARQLTVGGPVTVRAGDAEPLTAWVRWILDDQVGLEFARPISGALLDRLVQARPAVSLENAVRSGI